MRIQPRPVVLALVAALALAGRAGAQEEQVEQDGWKLVIEPYAWIPTLDGDGDADGSGEVDFDVEFPGGLSAALPHNLRLEAPGGSAWLFDGLYARWEDDDGSLRTETEVSLLEAGFAWPVSEDWDVAAGLRGVQLGLDVDAGGVGSDAQESWLDPWIGGRGDVPLGGNWALRARGDVGGFGVGSDFTWQAAALVGWGSGRWWLDLGYRALSVEFDDDDLDTEFVAHGPILGIGWRL